MVWTYIARNLTRTTEPQVHSSTNTDLYKAFIQMQLMLALQVPVLNSYGTLTLLSLCLQMSLHLMVIGHQYTITSFKMAGENLRYAEC